MGYPGRMRIELSWLMGCNACLGASTVTHARDGGAAVIAAHAVHFTSSQASGQLR
ncbi:hypothetical protein BAUCODRAFT_35722 [Baudoinia panamericana UAMH 10762]|uniref:Uncharacterized protein n=1 Tax=Baudoinia panamericana (strain UAMH 10762) TaxID=717646 RepID=M2LJW7_BAUPA|nr:uncharacterized protein BAUCODRAFT_35722 [Baudoinia panamericana UAMH 10762]EMC94502.1 hypothetical protein BAUCODRAFT_35722 [Baudoinia panamericana UAMH 10762]